MKAPLHLLARRTRLIGIAACVVVTGLLASGAALATLAGGGSIDGCYARSSGALRVIDPSASRCRDGETRLAWEQTPSQGPNGELGVSGAKGEPGDQGPQGPKGETGIIGFQGSDGPRGPVGPPGSHGYVIVWGEWQDLPPLGARSGSVACPAGKMIVSGGFELDNADAEQSQADYAGWIVAARGGLTGGRFAPVAICGNPA